MGKRGQVAMKAKRTSGKGVSVSPDALPASSYLSPLAKRYWRGVISSFPVGHFTESDRVLLEQFCVAAAMHQESTEFLDGLESRYSTDRYGKNTLHPAVKDQHQARCDCAMLATKLRITKQAMILPRCVGQAVHDAAEATKLKGGFGDLLFNGNEEVRQ